MSRGQTGGKKEKQMPSKMTVSRSDAIPVDSSPVSSQRKQPNPSQGKGSVPESEIHPLVRRGMQAHNVAKRVDRRAGSSGNTGMSTGQEEKGSGQHRETRTGRTDTGRGVERRSSRSSAVRPVGQGKRRKRGIDFDYCIECGGAGMIIRPVKTIRTTKFVQVTGPLGSHFEEQVIEKEIGGIDACGPCAALAEMEWLERWTG